MSLNIDIEPKEGYLKVLVTGEYVLYMALEEFAQVLADCSKNKLCKVLVDFRDVKGSATMEDKQEFLYSLSKQHSQFKAVCDISLEIAFVGPPSMILEGYADKVSSMLSFKLKSTTDITEAMEWLGIEKSNDIVNYS